MYKFFLMDVGLDSELLYKHVFRSLHFVIHYLSNIFNATKRIAVKCRNLRERKFGKF